MTDTEKGVIGLFFWMIVVGVLSLLKVNGTIDWSWWWITAPLWIPAGIGFIIGVIVGIIKGVKENL